MWVLILKVKSQMKCGILVWSSLSANIKLIFRETNILLLEIITYDRFIYTMDHHKCIV